MSSCYNLDCRRGSARGYFACARGIDRLDGGSVCRVIREHIFALFPISRHHPDSLRSRGRRWSSKGCASTEDPPKAGPRLAWAMRDLAAVLAGGFRRALPDLRRMVLSSTLAAPWPASVRPLPWAVLANGRPCAGSRRPATVAPPPRLAGIRGSGHGAQSGRRTGRR